MAIASSLKAPGERNSARIAHLREIKGQREMKRWFRTRRA